MNEYKSIQEIKLNKDNTATIKYQLVNQDSNQDVKFEGVEKITDEFRVAFGNVRSTIGEIIEVFQREKIKPQKITFDNKKNTVMYSFLYYPEDNLHPVVTVDTPKLPLLYDKKPSDNKFYVSGLDIELLKAVIKEALKYINGESRTKQIKLEVVE